MRKSGAKPRKPLEDTLFLIGSARELLLRYKTRIQNAPDEEDFLLLKCIYEKAQQIQLTATYVETCFYRRIAGEPEGPPPWKEDGRE